MEFPVIVVLVYRLSRHDDADPGSPPEVRPQAARGTDRLFELESTLVRDVVHQWFYAMVGSDQFAEPWIDESLA